MIRQIITVAVLVLGLTLSTLVVAKEILPMYGGVLIEGYEFGKDTGPKGTLYYDSEKNEFRGSYRGLKMPPGRRAMFAWVHDTVNQKSTYLGAVGGLEPGGRGQFTVKAPGEFAGGKFGSHEIIGFTAEETNSLNGTEVVTRPKEPSGTKSVPKPAFYLFSALPGADTDRHWCGMGQDFFYAKDPAKQTCYDCKCGVKYSVCIQVGLSLH